MEGEDKEEGTFLLYSFLYGDAEVFYRENEFQTERIVIRRGQREKTAYCALSINCAVFRDRARPRAD